MSRSESIDMFLNKWNEMMDAAVAIDGFEMNFRVSIRSDNDIIEDRIRTIEKINKSFTNHGYSWSSTNC